MQGAQQLCYMHVDAAAGFLLIKAVKKISAHGANSQKMANSQPKT